jgi:hypothetical protein
MNRKPDLKVTISGIGYLTIPLFELLHRKN